MVIQDNSEQPTEVFFSKKKHTQKSNVCYEKKEEYVVTNNSLMDIHRENSPGTETLLENKIKSKRKRSAHPSNRNENVSRSCEISAEDLNELKTVYRKCKAVIKKIEEKYGHILDFTDDEPKRKYRKQDKSSECQCASNKKIVFDDDGNELTIDTLPSNHICPQNLMCPKPKNPPETLVAPTNKGVQVEYSFSDIQLSDNLQELADILQNPDLEATYRNRVVDKVRTIKQENSNEIRFNKPYLVEKLKSEPETILDFKGANLSVLSGYT